MAAKRLSVFESRIGLSDGSTLRFVGTPPMVLNESYDPRQLWFPFVAAVVVTSRKREGGLLKSHDRPRGGPMLVTNKKLGKLMPTERRMYEHVAGVHQHLLPYREHQRISNSEFNTLKHADFPGWERLADGLVAECRSSMVIKESLARWCLENCQDRFYVSATKAGFASLDDASVAMLAFSPDLRIVPAQSGTP